MKERTHDTFPVVLKGGRRALLVLPVDLNRSDAELIVKQLNFVVECSLDHASHNAAQPLSATERKS